MTGCSPISSGCENCYAERMAYRLAHITGSGYETDAAHPYKGMGFDVRLRPNRLEQPFRWKKPRRIFVCSMGDLFHEDVPFGFIAAVFGVMAANPRHTFMVLTKRAERMWEFLDQLYLEGTPRLECAYELLNQEANDLTNTEWPIHTKWGLGPNGPWPLPNVWLGVTVENLVAAQQRIPLLLQTPATVRFVSCEPLLEPIDLTDLMVKRTPRFEEYWSVLPDPDDEPGFAYLDWVVVGGESGPGARPMHPDWVRSIRDQCIAADVPFFFKGWGEWLSKKGIPKLPWGTIDIDGNWFPETTPWNGRQGNDSDTGELVLTRVGKKAAGRELDGRTWDEVPIGSAINGGHQ